jgi:SAM-dependent methyltransferase
LTADIVGPEGAVVGVDNSQDAIRLASQRAHENNLVNVTFELADIVALTLREPVDVVVGRFVLMYFPDPVTIVRSLRRALKPGGLGVFQEMDIDASKAEPEVDIFAVSVARVREAMVRVGADVRVGLKLGRILEDAGFSSAKMVLGARIERGADALIYDQLADITRTLLPAMRRTGLISGEQLDVDTLADQIRRESVRQNATLVSPALIGAWARQG